MQRTLILALVLALAGCSWQELAHAPRPMPDKAGAMKLVERSLWEQYHDFAPKGVEVTPEYFRTFTSTIDTSHKGFVTTAMTSVEGASTVYYDNIGSATLYKKDLYQVLIRAKSGEEIFRYYQVSEDKARQFLDALEAMRH